MHLSPAQESLWVQDQLYPQDPAYNCPFLTVLKGFLCVPALEAALNEVLRRHDALRSSFVDGGSGPRTRIAQAAWQPLAIRDFRAVGEPRVGILRLVQEAALHPFDLARGPLFRVELFLERDGVALLFINFHHIIADHWSMGVFLAEVSMLYRAFDGGSPSAVAEPARSYTDYADLQNERLERGELDRALEAWKARLEGIPDLELLTDRPRRTVTSHRGGSVQARIPDALSARLRSLAVAARASSFMALLAALQAVLYRVTGQTDFGIGVPFANRNDRGFEGTIGFFVETVVMRSVVQNESSFRAILERTRSSVLAALAGPQVPFERLVSELRPSRNRRMRNPLFQVMFVHLRSNPEAALSNALSLSHLPLESRTAKFELTLSLVEDEDGFSWAWEYDEDLFERGSVEALSQQLLELLEAAVRDPDEPVRDFVLRGMGFTTGPLHSGKNDDTTLVGYFEKWRERVPDRVAIVTPPDSDAAEGSLHITYGALGSASDALATRLIEHGIGSESVVGIHATRSPEAVLAILATLKAQGAFLILDVSHPPDRLAFIARDAGAAVVLAGPGACNIERIGLPCIAIDGCAPCGDLGRLATLPTPADSSAYVVYTSGSTGQPKGVTATHRGSLNRFRWMWREFPFGSDELCCQRTPLSFVDSVWEILGPLLGGATSVIVSDAEAKDPEGFLRILAYHQTTRIVLVPTLLRALLAEWPRTPLPASLRFWVVSGEPLPGDMCARFIEATEGDALFLNLYGSSEVSADVTAFVVNRPVERNIAPIGAPIDQTSVAVMDAELRAMPNGAGGRLFVSGPNLARGYVGAPELTAAKFLPNPTPIREQAGFADLRMYRTGDKARFLSDGSLEYLGREDRQLKVLGCRLEPGEIEAALVRVPGVARAAVTLIGPEPTAPRLVAYLVLAAQIEPRLAPLPAPPELTHRIRQALLAKLPDFMVPSTYALISELPLTSSGKVDRRRLVDLGIPELPKSPLSLPPNAIELRLQAIALKASGRTEMHLDTRILDLGSSLVLVKLARALDDAFPGKVTVQNLFDNPSIRELALVIAPPQATATSELPPEVIEV
jgi:amino acid adenylation domain-containing protein